MTHPVAWMNGTLIDASQAAVPVGDLGVVAGATVSELLRTFQHRPYRLDDHIDRLLDSLKRLAFPTAVERETLRTAVETVATRNSQLTHPQHELGIVVFVTAGQNLTYLGAAGRDRAVTGTVCVHSFPLPFELWAERYSTGQHLTTVDVTPLPLSSVDPCAKHRNRLHWLRADQAARNRFAESSALLTMPDGAITETSSGNLFVLQENTLRTPRPHTVLCGISRSVLMEIARKLGLHVEETDLHPADLLSADEVLLTSTPYCVIPVTRFNGDPVQAGTPGPMYRRLIAAWSELAGVDIVRQAVEGAATRQ